jgi:rhodanese-related sulfurtransferase
MEIITVVELKKRLDAGEAINLLDVREPNEYAEYNIGAVLIPLGKIRNMETEQIDHLKNEEVIIHCRSGARSAMACQILEQMGFTNTKNVEGGVLAWIQVFGQ